MFLLGTVLSFVLYLVFSELAMMCSATIYVQFGYKYALRVFKLNTSLAFIIMGSSVPGKSIKTCRNWYFRLLALVRFRYWWTVSLTLRGYHDMIFKTLFLNLNDKNPSGKFDLWPKRTKFGVSVIWIKSS